MGTLSFQERALSIWVVDNPEKTYWLGCSLGTFLCLVLAGPPAALICWLILLALFKGWIAPAYLPESQGFGPLLVRFDCDEKLLALTFDDGPDQDTLELLEVLDRLEVQATFFLIGKQIEKRPEVAREIVRRGHQVGNHTYSHPDLSRCSVGQLAFEVDHTAHLIEQATGVRPRFFRPPYGFRNRSTMRFLHKRGYRVANWSVNSLDFMQLGVLSLYHRLLQRALPGDIILLHDGPGCRRQTVDAIALAIRRWQEQGYQFVRLDDKRVFGRRAVEST